MSRLSLAGRSQRLPLVATLLFAVALTLVLAYGMRRASQLQAASSALESASALAPQPQLITSELTLIQRGLESATYVGDALGNIHDSRTRAAGALQNISVIVARAGLARDSLVAGQLKSVQEQWQRYDTALAALDKARPDALYVDTLNGSQLSESGRALRSTVNGLLSSQERMATELSRQLTQLARVLQTAVAGMGSELRLLLLAGTLLASLLIALMLYFAMRARISGSAARQAARQVESILASVREGLFLVDRTGRIGRAHSSSLAELLHTPNPGGNTLSDVLRPMVDEKTQLAASKYLNLLWNERVNEGLIDSVNPLQQVAVSVARAGGGQETRYLSFAFHRASNADDYLLGSVADITDRVTLQEELERLKAAATTGGGSDLLLQLLRLDPAQLEAFIGSATRAFDSCNARLKAPGKDERALRDKLDAVFRELHAVKGESAALGLEELARMVHAAEDILTGLRDRERLAGNDFVPVVTHLDGLIRRLGEMADAQAQLQRYSHQPGPGGAAAATAGKTQAGASASGTFRMRPAPAPASPALERLLRSLVNEVGKAVERDVQLRVEGLDQVPPDYTTRVKDICVQMVRNAVVHGIEGTEQRTTAGKTPAGTIKVSFTDTGHGEYVLVIEDDGQGLSYDRILYRARQLSLVQPDQTALDRGSVFKMIFMPGFSTVEDANGHAGRGVGLDAVNALVRECGGRIGIATVPGQFTRFRVILPKALQQAAAQA